LGNNRIGKVDPSLTPYEPEVLEALVRFSFRARRQHFRTYLRVWDARCAGEYDEVILHSFVADGTYKGNKTTDDIKKDRKAAIELVWYGWEALLARD
jgi:hypothetical protein